MDSIQPILSMQNIVKRFGGNTAVNHVSLDVMPGEVVALLGENGAGKSTLIKILAGVYQRDAGDIVFGEKKIESARTLQKSGEYPIAFIHQDLGLVDWMTVAENMAFVMGFPRKLGFIDWEKVRQNSQKALQGIGIDIDPDTRVFELSRTEKSLLAIARAVAVDAEVLVLDEPTASLPADDVRHLFRVINKLRQRNVGMVYVTHRLDEVMDIADRVCVMRDGHYIAGGVTDQYDIGDLVKLIVGEEKKGDKRRPRPTGQPSTLSINELSVGDTGPVSFQLQRGEMIALAGLRGAGQEEIGRCLFGMRDIESGDITLGDAAYLPTSPQHAIASGISMVAGDRNGESLVTSMSVRENLFINPVNEGKSLCSYYQPKKEIGKAWWKVQLFDIRPKLVDIDVSALSGGNQQKVVMARWMHLETPILILEDPTAGVDVGARSEIYDLLNKALDMGIAIIVISTDFEEIAHICNRALVFNRGQVAGELMDNEVTFANLLALASGAQKQPSVNQRQSFNKTIAVNYEME